MKEKPYGHRQTNVNGVKVSHRNFSRRRKVG
jgi:hypothetical protein